MQSKLLTKINNSSNALLVNFINPRIDCNIYYPLLFMAGIFINLELPFEPNIFYILFIIGIKVISFFLLKEKLLRQTLLFMLTFFAGFLAISIKISIIDTNFIDQYDKFYQVKGIIEKISPMPVGYKIIINNVELVEGPPNNHLKKVKIVVRTKLNNAKVGNKVKFKAILSRPENILPNGYDFVRFAFFENIGAVGYSVSEIQIIERNSQNKFFNYINNIRYNIENYILTHCDKNIGSIISALMVGEYSAIDRKLIENIRISGLAHLLAISGLHMSLVAIIIFNFTRLSLCLYEKIALEYNIKKISAYITIIICIIYLFLTGMQVSAIRALIMIVIFLSAIIFDRYETGLRSMIIAASLILIFCPEYATYPSFQLSFAAVFALLLFAQKSSYIDLIIKQNNYFYRFFYYVFGLFVTSLIASLATAPIIAYHFGQFSLYSILANILVIPFVSFFLMPMIMLGYIFYGLNLLDYLLPIISLIIKYIIYIANLVAKMDSSVFYIPQFNLLATLFMILGFFSVLILKDKIRYVGLMFILLSLIIVFNKKPPDIIIDSDAKNIALTTNKGDMIYLNQIRSTFKKSAWQKLYAQKESLVIDNYLKDDIDFSCQGLSCTYKNKNKIILFIYAKDSTQCPLADLVIFLNSNSFCPNSKIINRNMINNNKTHLIYLNDQTEILSEATMNRHYRLWNK